MKLKHVNYCLYDCERKISEYTLLTEYNPIFINTKVKAINTQIEMMYHLNISHTTISESNGIVSTSCPIEKLVLMIIEEKEKLKHYKVKSSRKLKQLKRVISRYTTIEQQEIMAYMVSNGSTVNYGLIERLKCDLYQAITANKNNIGMAI